MAEKLQNDYEYFDLLLNKFDSSSLFKLKFD